MAVITAAPFTMTEYPSIFRGYIVRSAQHILARVRQAGYILPDDDREQALHTLSYALKLPEAWPDTRALLLEMAPKMEQAGYRDEWMPYLEQGIEQSQMWDDAPAAAELHLQLGLLYQLRSKYDQARTHLEISADTFARVNEPSRQAQALNRLAYVVRVQRRFEEATRLVAAAHQLLEPDDEEWAFGYYVLSLVALDSRDWQQAVDFSRRAFGLWEQAVNRRMMGRSLLCRGVALQELKRYPEAIRIDEQAIALFERSRDKYLKAIAQMNLGIVYKNLEQPQQAITFYLKAEKVFRQVQDRYHLGLVTHNMGLSYRKLGHWVQAKMAYQQSTAIKQELGQIALLVDDMDGLGLVYLAEGNLIKALEIFQEAKTWLAQIEDDVYYDNLFEMVSGHLQEVTNRLEPQDKER